MLSAVRAGDSAAVSAGFRRRWDARLDLRFKYEGERTRLVRRRHVGPLVVQRPFHPEPGGACHVYLLHPPGGLVSGDRLSVKLCADVSAEVLVTTPAAAKFYRSSGDSAEQWVSFDVERGATVEWLPQETILFGGAKAVNRIIANVHEGGQFIAWEICCLGRPASGDFFSTGSYATSLEISVEGRPVVVERGSVSAYSEIRQKRFGLGGSRVFGSFVALSERADLVDRVREALPAETKSGVFGVTAKRNALVCRYLGSSVSRAREGFVRAWSVTRRLLLGRAEVVPRIWAT